ncbi:MAG: ribosome maturation factor RimP [Cryomorphaceae bacterium]|nr:MAG: ribosome maturation factor RimP [Cryomorphaceae bacterium]
MYICSEFMEKDRRGQKSPLFILNMLKEKVEQLISEGVEGTDIFLVKLTVSSSNDINVLLDSDSGLTLSDCRSISRVIETSLDREDEDFSLTVSSSGVGEPLVLRQYKKNVGRKVRVTLIDGEIIEAKMVAADEKGIELEWKSREKKPTGKGKITVVNNKLLNYQSIKQTIVLITF